MPASYPPEFHGTPRSGMSVNAMPQVTEVREAGCCGQCGAPVLRVSNSILPTCRTDGRRYVDATRRDDGWCMFRCHNDQCRAVIDETWRPQAAPDFGPVARRDEMTGHD